MERNPQDPASPSSKSGRFADLLAAMGAARVEQSTPQAAEGETLVRQEAAAQEAMVVAAVVPPLAIAPVEAPPIALPAVEAPAPSPTPGGAAQPAAPAPPQAAARPDLKALPEEMMAFAEPMPTTAPAPPVQSPVDRVFSADPTFKVIFTAVTAPSAPPPHAVPAVQPVITDARALQDLGMKMQDALTAAPLDPPASEKTLEMPPVDVSVDAEAQPQTLATPLLQTPDAAPADKAVPMDALPGELARSAAEAWRERTPLNARNASVEIRLDPPSLGSVFVRVVENSGTVHAHVSAANPEVQRLLHEQMHALAQSLAQQGLQLGSLTVGLGGNSSGNSGQPQERPDSGWSEPLAETRPPPTRSRAAPGGPSRAVNIRA